MATTPAPTSSGQLGPQASKLPGLEQGWNLLSFFSPLPSRSCQQRHYLALSYLCVLVHASELTNQGEGLVFSLKGCVSKNQYDGLPIFLSEEGQGYRFLLPTLLTPPWL